ncbi:MAG: asparagine synthase (glutamine-hydrolyzing) [Cognaticolwellia sp.]|jgi:asparagine synthase (glutamine-hydrolysing)
MPKYNIQLSFFDDSQVNQNKYQQSGTAYIDNTVAGPSLIKEKIKESLTVGELDPFFESLNGFYALVDEEGGRIIAAVDHIRSIPLFYAQHQGELFLSDNAEWVRNAINDITMDTLAKDEFRLTSFVTGADTLFQNVKQLQAGEYLIADVIDDKLQVTTSQYFRFNHSEPKKVNEPELKKELLRTIENSIKRLIEYANGRQIVLPLSGGYDSRLIATILKQKNYHNIVTFTYGRVGNTESVYSKQVADSLDLPWHFIEYSDESWRATWAGEDRFLYQKNASNLNSLAVVQDWLAVKELKQRELVDNDCIFVPGHTGDFIAGGHIPDIAFEKNKFDRDDVIDEIVKKHYYLGRTGLFSEQKEHWRIRISKQITQSNITNAVDYANAVEQWNWQERQSKFINNSVRVYEFFGFDWWLPLWDREFVDFWQTVPLALRKRREWYNEFVTLQYQSITQVKNVVPLKNATKPVSLPKMRKLIGSLLPNFIKVRIQNSLNIKAFYRHPHCIMGRLDEEIWLEFFKEGYAQNGIVAEIFLSELSKTHAVITTGRT